MFRISILLLTAAIVALAQQSSDKSSNSDSVPAKADADAAAKKLRSDVLHMLEVDGSRERMRTGLKPLLEQGKTKMHEMCQDCDQFVDEWGRRMETRITVDAFLNVVAP